MKKFIVYILSSTVLLFAACTEDKGNYDYIDGKDIINISISNIDPEGYEVVIGERLQISPEVTGYIPGKEYQYEWYIVGSGSNNMIKTLSNTVELDEEISGIPTSTYALYLKVTDRETGVYVDHETSLSVSASALTTGWYILKEVDGMTDIDYCKSATKEIFPNILSRLAPDNYRMPGTPVGLAYQPSEYNYVKILEDGTTEMVSGQKALHVVTTEEMYTLHAEELTLFATLEDQFYSYPDTWKPQALTSSASGTVLINDGDIYTTYTAIAGLRKFGSPKIKGGSFFHEYMAYPPAIYGYDMATRSFVYSGSNLSSLIEFNTSAALPSKNTIYDVVAIPMNSYPRPGTRYFVVKSTENNKYYTASHGGYALSPSSTNPIKAYVEVPANSLMPTAKAYAALYQTTFLFGVGNTLYYYEPDAVGTTKEFELRKYPEGEEIVYMEYTSSVSHHISILTWNSSENTWSLYVHPMTGFTISNFTKEPSMTFTGEGKPVKAMPRP